MRRFRSGLESMRGILLLCGWWLSFHHSDHEKSIHDGLYTCVFYISLANCSTTTLLTYLHLKISSRFSRMGKPWNGQHGCAPVRIVKMDETRFGSLLCGNDVSTATRPFRLLFFSFVTSNFRLGQYCKRVGRQRGSSCPLEIAKLVVRHDYSRFFHWLIIVRWTLLHRLEPLDYIDYRR